MRRNVYLAMKSLKDAKEIFLGFFRDKTTIEERIPVEKALGRVTATPVVAQISAPTYHSAAMDGIAVKAEDTYGCTERSPKRLKIGEDAFWINTGHALPLGCNAVIMVEKVHELVADQVEIMSPVYPWENVRKVGEDIVATQLLFPKNHVIRAFDLGAMIAAGVFEVSVHKKPNVTIIPTGTEMINHRDIVDFSQLKRNQIVDSNSVTISGLVSQMHGEPCVLGITPDDEDAIRDVLLKTAETQTDLIVILAGSSAG
jgi:putative molybdopterin biosynthesis protein